MIAIFGLFILFWTIVVVGQEKMLPWLNKNIFSKIWSEEPHKAVTRETVERLAGLLLENGTPEDTAVLIAAREQGISERELLNSFGADDAKELVRILSSKNPSFGAYIVNKIITHPKTNMRGRI